MDFPLHELLPRAHVGALQLASARNSLEALTRQWRPSPWQRVRSHAENDDRLRERISALVVALKRELLDFDQLLSEARHSQPDSSVRVLASRLEVLRELLRLCRKNDCTGFLDLTAGHPKLSQLIPGLSKKRALVSDTHRSGPAWQTWILQARENATAWAFPNTPEWRRAHDQIVAQGGSLGTLIPRIEPLVARDEAALAAVTASHEERCHRDVALANPAAVQALAERLRVAAHLVAEVEAVRTREEVLIQAWTAPGLAAARLLPATTRTPPELDDEDRALAELWAGSAGGDPYRSEQMLSARQAEVTALELYRDLYGAAEDLSLGQVCGDPASRWMTADIRVPDRWIDVKNSRRSFSSPNTYSEHCVPRFKQDRRGQDVVISAFLSHYFRLGPNGVPEPVVWLGETTRSAVAELEGVFGSSYLAVDFSRAEVAMLPPWLFDYPAAFYRERDAVLAKLGSDEVTYPLHQVPVAVPLLLGHVPLPPCTGESEPTVGIGVYERELLELARRHSTVRVVTRPIVFLHILDRFCRSFLEGQPFPGEVLRALLFPVWSQQPSETPDDRLPLTLCDPLRIVSELLDVLQKASESYRSRAIAFRRFRLRAAGILQGLTASGTWRTIIAYCGGWGRLRDGRRVRCGQNPVFLGQDEPCELCDRLICHRCGYCSNACPACESRQQDWQSMEPSPSIAHQDRSGTATAY